MVQLGSDENGTAPTYQRANGSSSSLRCNGDARDLATTVDGRADSTRTGLELTTSISVEVSMQLLEAVTEAALSDMTVPL